MIPTRLGPNEKAGARLALPRMLLYNSAFPDQAVRAFAERLHTAGIEAVPSGEGEPFLQILQDRTLPAEGYRIIVQCRGVIVEASTQQGAILALTTTWKEHALHGSLPAGTFWMRPPSPTGDCCSTVRGTSSRQRRSGGCWRPWHFVSSTCFTGILPMTRAFGSRRRPSPRSMRRRALMIRRRRSGTSWPIRQTAASR